MLHFTFGMLDFKGQPKKLQKAIDVLKKLETEIKKIIQEDGEESLKLKLEGIGTFDQNPSKARVLFAKINQSDQKTFFKL